ncbi:MAG: hypothetical protein FRX49_09124 [Trebouxia sp. A1-2]|nr:MAG: hypothetical protein FRX49_09124 [Trebouxia sp. A1-2]
MSLAAAIEHRDYCKKVLPALHQACGDAVVEEAPIFAITNYEAHHGSKVLALKVFNVDDDTAVKSFVNELKAYNALSELQGQTIPALHSFGQMAHTGLASRRVSRRVSSLLPPQPALHTRHSTRLDQLTSTLSPARSLPAKLTSSVRPKAAHGEAIPPPDKGLKSPHSLGPSRMSPNHARLPTSIASPDRPNRVQRSLISPTHSKAIRNVLSPKHAALQEAAGQLHADGTSHRPEQQALPAIAKWGPRPGSATFSSSSPADEGLGDLPLAATLDSDGLDGGGLPARPASAFAPVAEEAPPTKWQAGAQATEPHLPNKRQMRKLTRRKRIDPGMDSHPLASADTNLATGQHTNAAVAHNTQLHLMPADGPSQDM